MEVFKRHGTKKNDLVMEFGRLTVGLDYLEILFQSIQSYGSMMQELSMAGDFLQ